MHRARLPITSISLLLLQLLFSGTVLAEDSRTEAVAMLERAAKAISFQPSDKKPTKISGALEFDDLKDGPSKGAWAFLTGPDNKSRTEIVLPNYRGDTWIEGELKWEQQNSKFTPIRVDQLEQILQLKALLEAAEHAAEFKLHSTKVLDNTTSCVLARSKTANQMLDLCIDSSNGTPLSISFSDITWRLSDYRKVGNGFFPGVLTATYDDRQMVRATVLHIVEDQDPAFLVPPSDVVAEAGPACGFIEEGALLKKISPDYPAVARIARIQGTVIVGAIITKEGKISGLRILQSAGGSLDNAALQAIREWRYKPYNCNGQPVEVKTHITMTFNLSG